MIPSFENYEDGFGAELKCPSCGCNYLHHDQVEVFECGEDEKLGVHVVIADGQAIFNTSLDGNPSARRHGLRIRFWCEGCKAVPVMSISQHKGNTYMNFG
jgi:hypothetical protein